MHIHIAIILMFSYFLGSIPSAVWIGKGLYGVDVRDKGSKNAGATNTFRVLGRKAGTVVLLMDIIKGVVAIHLTVIYLNLKQINLDTDSILIFKIYSGIAVFFGHLFPLFASFRGGKGVATTLGVLLYIDLVSALMCLMIFCLVFYFSKFVSLGAIIASLFFPFVVYLTDNNNSTNLIVFSVIISITVIFAHRKNIIRLLNKQENKLNLFKK